MNVNWMLVLILLVLSLPGTIIAINRLVSILLPDNTKMQKARMSRFAVSQILLMVFVMSVAGSALSPLTGLQAVYLQHFVDGNADLNSILSILLPTFSYTLLGLVVFCSLYYGVINPLIDKQSFDAITKVRRGIGVWGCMLYGGIVEEILARWGLMNLVTFFAMNIAGHRTNYVVAVSVLISGMMFAIVQMPLYVAAGCVRSRRLVYSIVSLSLCQSILFGFLFWKFSLLSAILGHIFFHWGWARYDKV